MSNDSNAILPYGRHSIDDADIDAVTRVLRGDWLTTGPTIAQFEGAFAEVIGAKHCVAMSSGTAGLHAAAAALGIGPGDEVVVPAITFAATANAVVYQGGTPVFADVDPGTLLIDASSVREKINSRTKAIIAVDYAGQPSNYSELLEIAREHGLRLAADACHALGARYQGRPLGQTSELSVFSLHPVKHVTAGEGGVVACEDEETARYLRRFRNHGIDLDHAERAQLATYEYDMIGLGYNYRMTDIQAALAISQLKKLPAWLERRRELAARYASALTSLMAVEPLVLLPDRSHAWHIYVVKLKLDELDCDRQQIFREMREKGIGVNVHYRPVHLQSFYREKFGCAPGLCPNAESAYQRILTLPLFPMMRDADVDRVVETLGAVLARHARKRKRVNA